jgi:hypothetical protein
MAPEAVVHPPFSDRALRVLRCEFSAKLSDML